MNLPHSGFDNNSTYFEYNLKSKEVPNIFIHGVGLDNNMWLPQKSYFKDKEVIYYDLLNHGNSKKGYRELYFEYFSNQLNQLVEYLNIKKFNLIGFSIGALIAQHFASNFCEKINKLIILASVYKRSPEQIIKVRNRYETALKGGSITRDSINRWFNKEYLIKNKKVYNFFLNILDNKKQYDFLPAYKLFVESENYPIDLCKITMPTLIMTGENDIGSTPSMSVMLHKEINNSDIFIIPKARHMASYEKSDVINEKIDKFLNI
tara:strand:+ start:1383 stop:2171 length:789 start_codon:yes stop_codon:yes gene_type:complete